MPTEQKIFRITIPLEPRPSERPRINRGRKRPYTPPRMKKYKSDVGMLMKAAMRDQGLTPFEGPVAIRADFYMKRPKRGDNRHADYCLTKPDIDNLEKLINDCGGPGDNNAPGIVLKDDKLIVDSHTTKQYEDGQGPCTVYEVRELSATDRPNQFSKGHNRHTHPKTEGTEDAEI